MADFAHILAQGRAGRNQIFDNAMSDVQRQEAMRESERRDLEARLMMLQSAGAQEGIDLSGFGTVADASSALAQEMGARRTQQMQQQEQARRIAAFSMLNQHGAGVADAAGSVSGDSAAAEQMFNVNVSPMIESGLVTVDDANRSLQANRALGQERRKADVAKQEESMKLAEREQSMRLRFAQEEINFRKNVALDTQRIELARQMGLDDDAAMPQIIAAQRDAQNAKLTAQERALRIKRRGVQYNALEAFNKSFTDSEVGNSDITKPAQRAAWRSLAEAFSDSDLFPIVIPGKRGTFGNDPDQVFLTGPQGAAEWMTLLDVHKNDPIYADLRKFVDENLKGPNRNPALVAGVKIMEQWKKDGRKSGPGGEESASYLFQNFGSIANDVVGDIPDQLRAGEKAINRGARRLETAVVDSFNAPGAFGTMPGDAVSSLESGVNATRRAVGPTNVLERRVAASARRPGAFGTMPENEVSALEVGASAGKKKRERKK